jgi:hypothetical protein
VIAGELITSFTLGFNCCPHIHQKRLIIDVSTINTNNTHNIKNQERRLSFATKTSIYLKNWIKDKDKSGMLTSDAFARSFLERTPTHLCSTSTTGTPEMLAKWWSISSRACSGEAVIIVFDITSAKCVDGCAWEQQNQHWSSCYC